MEKFKEENRKVSCMLNSNYYVGTGILPTTESARVLFDIPSGWDTSNSAVLFVGIKHKDNSVYYGYLPQTYYVGRISFMKSNFSSNTEWANYAGQPFYAVCYKFQ